jgi:excinuclease ABC subunit A
MWRGKTSRQRGGRFACLGRVKLQYQPPALVEANPIAGGKRRFAGKLLSIQESAVRGTKVVDDHHAFRGDRQSHVGAGNHRVADDETGGLGISSYRHTFGVDFSPLVGEILPSDQVSNDLFGRCFHGFNGSSGTLLKCAKNLSRKQASRCLPFAQSMVDCSVMPFIRIRDARQNNLKGVDLDIPLGKMTVVTGLSGSGKSSLVFDTLYAEGQRRYVETFSPYARQFLERLDSPRVGSIENIPPAIAIQQGNTVKTSRSTVGTLTELCDYFKLLMPHRARLFCPECGKEVLEDTPEDVFRAFEDATAVLICFPVTIPAKMSFEEVARMLLNQGYQRWWDGGAVRELGGAQAEVPKPGGVFLVIQDRLAVSAANRSRFIEAAEVAYRVGKGQLTVITPDDAKARRFSKWRHCAPCNRCFPSPTTALFSFNNPLGACPHCRGFGRTIEIDPQLVVPDGSRSLRGGVVKPWQGGYSKECQDDLMAWCKRRNVDVDRPFDELPEKHRRWVWDGDPEDPGDTGYGPWYGIRGYFRWLESKSYKMHMRVLLSRYRRYQTCSVCNGARFQPETLNYRLEGKNLAELYAMPIDQLRTLLEKIDLPRASAQDPTRLVVSEILSRLKILGEVGLDYLTLDRSARTLSGGEVQRVNLTTCLGAGMVNTLFILDEPSVGLHPRDIANLVRVLHALRDRGNTLVVVEHDPIVIRAADHWIDLGPRAGEEGGEIVREGKVSGLIPQIRNLLGSAALPQRQAQKSKIQNSASLTLDYLAGARQIPWPEKTRPVTPQTSRLRVEGAAENNLRDLSLDVPLGRFVCVTGVSGSGKSTLVHRVLFENLQKLRGKNDSEPGRCRRVKGHEVLHEVILVDQAPLSRTSRSNPVVYVGAWDSIRELFGMTAEARRQGLSASAFSFNAGEGRCPRCRGNGHERVEMQFLADVYIPCPECRGKRFRAEVLGISLGGRTVADLLEATIHGTRQYLEDLPVPSLDGDTHRWIRWRDDALARLRLLERVGLGYLRLGQPLPTLSGGEAQRLKLCGFLADSIQALRVTKNSATPRKPAAKPASGSLLIFDEPTTGLHFDDVCQLIGVFQQLTDQGHSLLVIEHNLELIKCADWIIDLGLEAGDRGGEVVTCGTPQQVAAHPSSWTGKYLQSVSKGFRSKAQSSEPKAKSSKLKAQGSSIRITHARENNLKNLSLSIPRDRFVVITGLSGSGKSSLAFDLVFNEGQRRFLDCMSAYARQYIEQMPRADVDHVDGIPPTVAIEQRVTRGGWKSTVATITEVYHFIRLLYARVGVPSCLRCGIPIREQTEESAIEQAVAALRRHGPQRILVPLVRGRKGFHTEIAEWAGAHGFDRLRVDGRMVEVDKFQKLARYVEHTIELDGGRFMKGSNDRVRLRELLRIGRGMFVLEDSRGRQTVVNTARACPKCGESSPPLDPKDFSFNSPSGWCPECRGYGFVKGVEFEKDLDAEHEMEQEQRIERQDLAEESEQACPACHGARLKAVALRVSVGGRTVADLNGMSASEAVAWFDRLVFKGRDHLLARDVIPQIVERLRFMKEVGLDYLQLGRAATTLSGGETQRIRLAAQLGSNLRGVLYVLDEPTIGLHPRDNERLLKILDQLKQRGNSLLVVEHDEETIRRADWIVDLGPGAGKHGGELVWEGDLKDLKTRSQKPKARSRTLEFLVNPMRHPMRGQRRGLQGVQWLEVKGAALHNLKRVRARFPIGRLTVVTGVSGAGKSSLVRGTLLAGLRDSKSPAGRLVKGRDRVSGAYEVDQSPIGKTPRSCPATYLGVWNEIRRLFASTPNARMRGYTSSRFSFNVKGGQCERCEGQGRIRLEMSFLPDAYVACEVCGGMRFNSATLEATYRDRTIADVLRMSVEEAVEFFSFDRKISEPLKLLHDTGLDYLTLGQSSPTLSGGEAQRMKLVSELMRGSGSVASRVRRHGCLYILEEPTIGLHFADVEKLVGVLHRLVDGGHTVVVIEHNPDVMAEADYIVDLGPEGGEKGGRIVAEGPPEEVAQSKASHTARFLRTILARSARA